MEKKIKALSLPKFDLGRVVQTQSREKKLEDELHEMAKPLARYRNDADLEEMLRNQERQDDPMLAFMTKKKVKQDEKAGKKCEVSGKCNSIGYKLSVAMLPAQSMQCETLQIDVAKC